MTALQELCKKLEGNIRKGWVDHFLALEKKQIAQAFSDGQYNGMNYYKGPLVTGNYYYQETYGEDGQKDPLPSEDIG
jgi:hypothetical protein